MTATVTPVPPRLQADRLLVPDVARGVALLAMLIAHAAPLLPHQSKIGVFIGGQINDLASPLFALTMGVAAAIVLTKARGDRRSTTAVIIQNLLRGAILVVLGILLESWGSWIAVVLSFLGLVLAIGTPLLLMRTRWLAIIAGAFVLVSDPLNAFVTSAVPPVWLYDGTPLAVITQWFFTNPHYRFTNLLPMFLVGAILFRIGFEHRRLAIGLLVGGTLLWSAALAVSLIARPEYRSGNYLDTVHDAGLVAFTLGAIMLVVDLLGQERASRVLVPFRAIGSLSLSLYVLQVGIVAIMAHQPGRFPMESDDYLGWCIIVLGVTAVGILWWRFVGKGPIEWLIGVVSGRYRLGR